MATLAMVLLSQDRCQYVHDTFVRGTDAWYYFAKLVAEAAGM